MLIRKSFKFRLYPNKEQEKSLCQQAGNTRFIWNKLLELNQKTYKETQKFQFSYEMIMSIPKLKDQFEFLKLSFSQSLQQVGKHLDKALKHSFSKQVIKDRKIKILQAKTEKQKLKAFNYGKPKFKKKKNFDSFTIPQKYRLSKNFVFIPKVGETKWKRHRKLQGKPKHLTVSRDGNQWYCSVTCELNIPKKQYSDKNIVGIDVGLKEFATMSDNSKVKRKRHLNKYDRKLKREQRWLSRKIKNSNNRRKQIAKVHIVHRKIRNTRKDFLHKTSSNMIAKYSGVVLEDLNVSGMMKNHKLARSISDVSWYEFMRMLEYKSLWNAKHFIKIDRWYASSKLCNNCGNKKVDLTLKDRIYKCENCGKVLDRDYNASKNILAEGLNVLHSTVGCKTTYSSETTVGHTGSNACGDDKVAEPRSGSVVVCETRKRKIG